MKVRIGENKDIISYWTAEYIVYKINQFNPHVDNLFTLLLPTGKTPLLVYKNLINFFNKKKVSFKHVRVFALDEYVGLNKNDERSYYYYMKNNFIKYIDIDEKNFFVLNGMADNLKEECNKYEKKLLKYKINLAVLGVGQKGHIGFNEPGSSLKSRTRPKTLYKESVLINNDLNNQILPCESLTVGIGTIMESQEIILLASGNKKADAIKHLLEGNISNSWPVTVLQNHINTIVFCDDDSTNEIKVKTKEYFLTVQNKTNIFGDFITNNINKIIKPNEKIIVFSPHPDDDIIGVGGTLQLIDCKNIKVIYMTSGSGGLENNYKQNPRPIEANLALKILGLNKKGEFYNFPFYNEPQRIKCEKDTQMINNIFLDEEPDHIFVCADCDPKMTHKICFNIIRSGTPNKNLKNIILYNSIWDDWNNFTKNHFIELKKTKDLIVRFDKEIFRLKYLALLMHDSQDPPLVTNEKIDSFHTQLIYLNKENLCSDMFKEHFKMINREDFFI